MLVNREKVGEMDERRREFSRLVGRGAGLNFGEDNRRDDFWRHSRRHARDQTRCRARRRDKLLILGDFIVPVPPPYIGKTSAHATPSKLNARVRNAASHPGHVALRCLVSLQTNSCQGDPTLIRRMGF